MKRNKPKLPKHEATVNLPTEPQWTDITERIREAANNTTVILQSDSKITSDVTDALSRGVRIRLNDFKLWVDPKTKMPALRMSWEVVL